MSFTHLFRSDVPGGDDADDWLRCQPASIVAPTSSVLPSASAPLLPSSELQADQQPSSFPSFPSILSPLNSASHADPSSLQAPVPLHEGVSVSAHKGVLFSNPFSVPQASEVETSVAISAGSLSSSDGSSSCLSAASAPLALNANEGVTAGTGRFSAHPTRAENSVVTQGGQESSTLAGSTPSEEACSVVPRGGAGQKKNVEHDVRLCSGDSASSRVSGGCNGMLTVSENSRSSSISSEGPVFHGMSVSALPPEGGRGEGLSEGEKKQREEESGGVESGEGTTSPSDHQGTGAVSSSSSCSPPGVPFLPLQPFPVLRNPFASLELVAPSPRSANTPVPEEGKGEQEGEAGHSRVRTPPGSSLQSQGGQTVTSGVSASPGGHHHCGSGRDRPVGGLNLETESHHEKDNGEGAEEPSVGPSSTGFHSGKVLSNDKRETDGDWVEGDALHSSSKTPSSGVRTPREACPPNSQQNPVPPLPASPAAGEQKVFPLESSSRDSSVDAGQVYSSGERLKTNEQNGEREAEKRQNIPGAPVTAQQDAHRVEHQAVSACFSDAQLPQGLRVDRRPSCQPPCSSELPPPVNQDSNTAHDKSHRADASLGSQASSASVPAGSPSSLETDRCAAIGQQQHVPVRSAENEEVCTPSPVVFPLEGPELSLLRSSEDPHPSVSNSAAVRLARAAAEAAAEAVGGTFPRAVGGPTGSSGTATASACGEDRVSGTAGEEGEGRELRTGDPLFLFRDDFAEDSVFSLPAASEILGGGSSGPSSAGAEEEELQDEAEVPGCADDAKRNATPVPAATRGEGGEEEGGHPGVHEGAERRTDEEPSHSQDSGVSSPLGEGRVEEECRRTREPDVKERENPKPSGSLPAPSLTSRCLGGSSDPSTKTGVPTPQGEGQSEADVQRATSPALAQSATGTGGHMGTKDSPCDPPSSLSAHGAFHSPVTFEEKHVKAPNVHSFLVSSSSAPGPLSSAGLERYRMPQDPKCSSDAIAHLSPSEMSASMVSDGVGVLPQSNTAFSSSLTSVVSEKMHLPSASSSSFQPSWTEVQTEGPFGSAVLGGPGGSTGEKDASCPAAQSSVSSSVTATPLVTWSHSQPPAQSSLFRPSPPSERERSHAVGKMGVAMTSLDRLGGFFFFATPSHGTGTSQVVTGLSLAEVIGRSRQQDGDQEQEGSRDSFRRSNASENEGEEPLLSRHERLLSDQGHGRDAEAGYGSGHLMIEAVLNFPGPLGAAHPQTTTSLTHFFDRIVDLKMSLRRVEQENEDPQKRRHSLTSEEIVSSTSKEKEVPGVGSRLEVCGLWQFLFLLLQEQQKVLNAEGGGGGRPVGRVVLPSVGSIFPSEDMWKSVEAAESKAVRRVRRSYGDSSCKFSQSASSGDVQGAALQTGAVGSEKGQNGVPNSGFLERSSAKETSSISGIGPDSGSSRPPTLPPSEVVSGNAVDSLCRRTCTGDLRGAMNEALSKKEFGYGFAIANTLSSDAANEVLRAYSVDMIERKAFQDTSATDQRESSFSAPTLHPGQGMGDGPDSRGAFAATERKVVSMSRQKESRVDWNEGANVLAGGGPGAGVCVGNQEKKEQSLEKQAVQGGGTLLGRRWRRAVSALFAVLGQEKNFDPIIRHDDALEAWYPILALVSKNAGLMHPAARTLILTLASALFEKASSSSLSLSTSDTRKSHSGGPHEEKRSGSVCPSVDPTPMAGGRKGEEEERMKKRTEEVSSASARTRYEYTHASQLCFLLSGEAGAVVNDTAFSSLRKLNGVRVVKAVHDRGDGKMHFIGANWIEALILTETLEYIYRLYDPQFMYAQLIPLKIRYALFLAELGLVRQALGYCTMAASFLRALPQARVPLELKHFLRQCHQRIEALQHRTDLRHLQSVLLSTFSLDRRPVRPHERPLRPGSSADKTQAPGPFSACSALQEVEEDRSDRLMAHKGGSGRRHSYNEERNYHEKKDEMMAGCEGRVMSTRNNSHAARGDNSEGAAWTPRPATREEREDRSADGGAGGGGGGRGGLGFAGGWLSDVLGGIKKALSVEERNLGVENAYYYDHVQKRWRERGREHEEEDEAQQETSHPLSSSSSGSAQGATDPSTALPPPPPSLPPKAGALGGGAQASMRTGADKRNRYVDVFGNSNNNKSTHRNGGQGVRQPGVAEPPPSGCRDELTGRAAGAPFSGILSNPFAAAVSTGLQAPNVPPAQASDIPPSCVPGMTPFHVSGMPPHAPVIPAPHTSDMQLPHASGMQPPHASSMQPPQASGMQPPQALGMPPPHASGMPPPHASGMPPPHASGMPPPHAPGMPPPHAPGMPPPHASGMPPPHASGLPPPHASGLPPPHASGMQPPHASGMQPPHASGISPPQAPGISPPQATLQFPGMPLAQASATLAAAPGIATQGATRSSSDGGGPVHSVPPFISKGAESNIQLPGPSSFFPSMKASFSLAPPASQTFANNGAVVSRDAKVGSRAHSVSNLFTSDEGMNGPSSSSCQAPGPSEADPSAMLSSGGLAGERKIQDTLLSQALNEKNSSGHGQNNGATACSPSLDVHAAHQLNGVHPRESNSQTPGVVAPPVRTSPFQASAMASTGGAKGGGVPQAGTASQGAPVCSTTWPHGLQYSFVPATNVGGAGSHSMNANTRAAPPFSNAAPGSQCAPFPSETAASQPPAAPFAFPRPPSFLLQAFSQGNPAPSVTMLPPVNGVGSTFNPEKQDGRDPALLHPSRQGEATPAPIPPPRTIRW